MHVRIPKHVEQEKNLARRCRNVDKVAGVPAGVMACNPKMFQMGMAKFRSFTDGFINITINYFINKIIWMANTFFKTNTINMYCIFKG